MPINAAQVVESVTGIVQSAQSGVELGSSSNGFESYLNTLNLAGTIAGASPVGVGLNAAAAIAGTVGLTNKWINGTLTAADVMSVTGGILGTVLAVAAVSGAPITAGALAIAAGTSIVGGPGAKDWFNDKATGLADAIVRATTGTLKPSIDSAVNSCFRDAQNYVIPRRDPCDPLVLDLDGDGLELISANGTVLFDHNADGIKTGTGWAAPNDGLLVRDLNGNGLIDSGRELFGIDTLKANNTFATQGFDALKELDSNADGLITNLDAAFSQLKVWQDFNQDGVSQANELKTLSQWGITSISATGSTSGPQAGQVIAGNRVDLSATFTQNGATRTVGSVDFQVNNFFTQFPAQVVDEAGNSVAITAQAQALPQMNGSGMVRNMHAAASLSAGFATALQTFADTTTRDGQRSQLDNLITKWAQTSTFCCDRPRWRVAGPCKMRSMGLSHKHDEKTAFTI